MYLLLFFMGPEGFRGRERREVEMGRGGGSERQEALFSVFGFEGSQAVPVRPSGREDAYNWNAYTSQA
jgi:hypothetical protein